MTQFLSCLLALYFSMPAEAALEETLQALSSTHRALQAALSEVSASLARVEQLETRLRGQLVTLLQDLHQELRLNHEQIQDNLQLRLNTQGVWIQHAAGLMELPFQAEPVAPSVGLPNRLEWRQSILTHVPYAGSFWGVDETIMRDTIGRAAIRSLSALEERFQGQDWIQAFRGLDATLRSLSPLDWGLAPEAHASAIRALDYIASLVPPMSELCFYHGILPPLGMSLLRIEEVLGMLWLACEEVSFPIESKKALFRALSSSQTAHNGSPFFGIEDTLIGLDQPSCPKGFFVRALEALDHVHPSISLGQLEADPNSSQIAEATRDIIHLQLLQDPAFFQLRQAALRDEDLFFSRNGSVFREALIRGLELRFPLASAERLQTFLTQDEVIAYAQYFVDALSDNSSVESQI